MLFEGDWTKIIGFFEKGEICFFIKFEFDGPKWWIVWLSLLGELGIECIVFNDLLKFDGLPIWLTVLFKKSYCWWGDGVFITTIDLLTCVGELNIKFCCLFI